MKKNVKVCFAGASAVLHCQNGNGHRVAPSSHRLVIEFRHFLDYF